MAFIGSAESFSSSSFYNFQQMSWKQKIANSSRRLKGEFSLRKRDLIKYGSRQLHERIIVCGITFLVRSF